MVNQTHYMWSSSSGVSMNTQLKVLTASFVLLAVSGCTTLSPDKAGESAGTDMPGITVVTQEHSAATEATAAPEIDPELLENLPAGTDIIIRPGKQRTIQEYRVNGVLYSIKVTPKVGKPYYLVAVDRSGNFMRSNRPQMLIPSWTLFQW